MNMISYKPLVRISPNLQFGAVGDIDELIRFLWSRGQKAKVTTRSNMVKNQSFKMYLSGE